MKALKTERGWEMADKDGIFESEETSPVFTSKAACQAEINKQAQTSRFCESQSAISGDNF